MFTNMMTYNSHRLETFSSSSSSSVCSNRKDDDSGTAVDVKLFKAIGLYQLLCSAFGERYRAVLLTVLRVTFAMQAARILGLFWALDDLQRFTNTALLVADGMLSIFKGHVLVTSADRMWAVLDAARYGFVSTSRGHRRHRSELRRCRATLSVPLRAFAAFSYVTLVVWIAVPHLMDEYVPLADRWVPTPRSVSNVPAAWVLFAMIEAFLLTVNAICFTAFNCYLVTTCFVLNAHFRVITAEYRTIGRPGSSPPSSLSLHTSGDESKLDYYEDLIHDIKVNQKVLKKYDEFLDIVQPVVIVQIASGTYSVVALTFLTSLLCLTGWSFTSLPVLKFFSGLMLLSIQVYIYCFALNYIEVEKTKLNFGLYSCNWTAMDLKFRKTMLIAMHMNSAHKRVLKVAPNSIINLEMFTRVINMSYTAVSVLLNASVR